MLTASCLELREGAVCGMRQLGAEVWTTWPDLVVVVRQPTMASWFRNCCTPSLSLVNRARTICDDTTYCTVRLIVPVAVVVPEVPVTVMV
jgi:hypothetical protein